MVHLRQLSFFSILLFFSFVQCDSISGSTGSNTQSPSSELNTAILQQPADNSSIQSTSVTLKWREVQSAAQYRVQLSTSKKFSSPQNDTLITNESYKVKGLNYNETYFWRVRSINNEREGEWSNVSSFQTTKAADNPAKVMPLGDSITEAFGYRLKLWNKLSEHDISIDYVGSQSDPHPDLPDTDHEGHGGWNIKNISQEVNGWLSTYNPDIILLMIGTNDLAWWTTKNGEEVAEAHADLVDQILANSSNGTELVVASIPPQSSKIIEPNNVDRAQLVKDFNTAMQKKMQQRIDNGKPIHFVDMYAKLSVDQLKDGIHPTDAGYEIIAQAWFETLQNMLK